MLLTRVVTAAVLLLILVVAAQAGDHVLNAVLAVGYGITLAEWLKLTKLSGTPSYLLGGCFALAGAGLALGAADLDVFGSAYLVLQLAVACIWLAVTAVCYNARNIGFGVARPAATVLAFVVTTATWLAVWQFLRLGSWPLLISVFMIVWLADACAYFAGRLFGKNRMAPAISPKKTWEGFIGGVVFSCLLTFGIAMLLTYYNCPLFNKISLDKWYLILIISLVIPFVGTLGDLFFSSVKRHFNIKDFGVLLKSHGGVLDRMDSILFACIVGTLIVALINIF